MQHAPYQYNIFVFSPENMNAVHQENVMQTQHSLSPTFNEKMYSMHLEAALECQADMEQMKMCQHIFICVRRNLKKQVLQQQQQLSQQKLLQWTVPQQLQQQQLLMQHQQLQQYIQQQLLLQQEKYWLIFVSGKVQNKVLSDNSVERECRASTLKQEYGLPYSCFRPGSDSEAPASLSPMTLSFNSFEASSSQKWQTMYYFSTKPQRIAVGTQTDFNNEYPEMSQIQKMPPETSQNCSYQESYGTYPMIQENDVSILLRCWNYGHCHGIKKNPEKEENWCKNCAQKGWDSVNKWPGVCDHCRVLFMENHFIKCPGIKTNCINRNNSSNKDSN